MIPFYKRNTHQCMDDETVLDLLIGGSYSTSCLSKYVRLPKCERADLVEYLKFDTPLDQTVQFIEASLAAIHSKPHVVTADGLNLQKIYLTEGRLGDVQEIIRDGLREVNGIGRCFLLADYFADEPANAQAHLVMYNMQSEIEVVGDGRGLRKVVLRENDDELLKLEIDHEGFYAVTRLNNDGDAKGDTIRPSINGKFLTTIPGVFINAYDLSFYRRKSPVLTMANLEWCNRGLTCEQKQGLHYTASPQPWCKGLDATEAPKSISPMTMWQTANANAEFGILEIKGYGLAERAKEIVHTEFLMASAGFSALLPKGQAHTVARTISLKSQESLAPLQEIVANFERGLTIALSFIAEWKGVATPVVKLNKDLVSTQWSSDMVRALHEMKLQGTISFQTFIDTLRFGEILPATTTAEVELDRLEDDPTAVIGQRAEDALRDAPLVAPDA